jgi:hypothetical protein
MTAPFQRVSMRQPLETYDKSISLTRNQSWYSRNVYMRGQRARFMLLPLSVLGHGKRLQSSPYSLLVAVLSLVLSSFLHLRYFDLQPSSYSSCNSPAFSSSSSGLAIYTTKLTFRPSSSAKNHSTSLNHLLTVLHLCNL